MDTSELRKASEEVPGELDELTASFSVPLSRRWLLGAAAVAAGTVVTGVAAATLSNTRAVHAEVASGGSILKEYFSILATQQLGEELTNGALLAWIKDMAMMNRTRLAEIGGQLMQVEGGHRVVGRVIQNATPWDN
jgi:hypothetical protein